MSRTDSPVIRVDGAVPPSGTSDLRVEVRRLDSVLTAGNENKRSRSLPPHAGQSGVSPSFTSSSKTLPHARHLKS